MAKSKVKSPRVDALREELLAEKAELEAQLARARAFYEQHVNNPQYREACRVIKEVNQRLMPVLNDLAKIARSKGPKASLQVEPGEYKSEAP